MNTHSPDFLAGERAALLRVRDDLDAGRVRYEAKSAESHGSLMAYYGDLASGLREAVGRVDLELARVEAKQHKARLGL